jgi:hypothetical protein
MTDYEAAFRNLTDKWHESVKHYEDRIEKLERENNDMVIHFDGLVARTEKLEAALRHCINALREYEMGDDRPRGPIPNDDLRPWLLGAMDNARKALDAE